MSKKTGVIITIVKNGSDMNVTVEPNGKMPNLAPETMIQALADMISEASTYCYSTEKPEEKVSPKEHFETEDAPVKDERTFLIEKTVAEFLENGESRTSIPEHLKEEMKKDFTEYITSLDEIPTDFGKCMSGFLGFKLEKVLKEIKR